MRWNEIVREELGMMDQARSYIMDVISSLRAQKMRSITVQQIVDQLRANPDFEGSQIEGDMVGQALKNTKGISIKPDDQTGEMSVTWDAPITGRQVDAKQAEKDDKAIHSAALRSIDRKEGDK